MADKHILLSRRAAAFTFSLLLIFFSHVTSMLLGTECPGSFNCTYNGHVFCQHIPCPLPPCDQPLVTSPGDCCAHCPSHVRQLAADPCPYNCTQGGVHYCYPIPCAMPPCVDGKTRPGECCASCPNGPNCSAPDGHVIPWKHWRVIDGKNCTCVMPPHSADCV